MTSIDIKLQILVAMAVAMIVTGSDAAIIKTLDCSTSMIKVPLTQFEEACVTYSQSMADDKVGLSMMTKLDTIHSCSCNLLSYNFVWESMYTHEVEILYLAIKEVFGHSLVERPSDEPKLDHPMFNPVNGDPKMALWDHVTSVIVSEDSDSMEITTDVVKTYAGLYYNPITYKLEFQGATGSKRVRRSIEQTCKFIDSGLELFLRFFQNARVLTNNDRIVYRIFSYDDTIHKLLMVHKICKFINAK